MRNQVSFAGEKWEKNSDEEETAEEELSGKTAIVFDQARHHLRARRRTWGV